MTDKQIFRLKVFGVLAFAVGGWLMTLNGVWRAGLTPGAVSGLLVILAGQVGSILAIVPPKAQQAIDLALLSGMHTRDDVAKLQSVIVPGVIPPPQVVAAVLDKKVLADGISVVAKETGEP